MKLSYTTESFRKRYEPFQGAFYEHGLYRIFEPSHNTSRWLIYHGRERLSQASDYLEAIYKINRFRGV